MKSPSVTVTTWLIILKTIISRVQGGTVVAISTITSSFSRNGSLQDLFTDSLSWATSNLAETCDAYDVEIRYYCQQNPLSPPPSQEEFDRVCDEVISNSLKKHYERNFTVAAKTYELTITPNRIKGAMEENLLKIILGFDCLNSSNFIIAPALLFYCDFEGDDTFMDIAAHEIGRGIAYVAGGMMYALTNKGSTTADQVGLGETEADCHKAELDIMLSYDTYAHSCWPRKYYAMRKLAREEAEALVIKAERGSRPERCEKKKEPGPDDFCGNFCFTDSNCGGSCSDCSWFKCQG